MATVSYGEDPVSKRKEDSEHGLHWVHVILLSVTPLLFLYGIMTTEVHRYTFYFTVVYYIFSGLGITAGYHRLWAHRCFKAKKPLQVFLALGGSAAVQGSIFWWSRDHRAHHRYTDTPKDPYDATRGFFYCHMGWMLVRKNRSKVGYAEIDDLKKDGLVRFQHKWYPIMALVFGIAIPTIVPGLVWGDWRGGYFYAAIGRMVFLHHATFCVNSLAHTIGARPYDDRTSPRDSVVTAVVTLGEGYHNFHHEYPNDYRNAIRFYQYDPTKWFIRLNSLFGQAYDLKTFPKNEIEKGYWQMKLKTAERKLAELKSGIPESKLIKFSIEDFEKQVKVHGKDLMIVDGNVVDISYFMDEHPGGRKYLQNGIGKDVTSEFNGGVYDHHNAARNLMMQFRIGVIV